MSHLEIVQKLNEFIKNKELDKIRPLLHKNIKWNQMKGFPNGGEYIGADGKRKQRPENTIYEEPNTPNYYTLTYYKQTT